MDGGLVSFEAQMLQIQIYLNHFGPEQYHIFLPVWNIHFGRRKSHTWWHLGKSEIYLENQYFVFQV